jgi:hypothetical protein
VESDFGRTDDVDHDLLTFGEAGARLREHIAEERRRIGELESGGDEAALARTRERLHSLEEAMARNTERRITDENFREFFGYTTTPSRDGLGNKES